QTVALERINNVLTPAIEHIQTVQDKGFLLAHSPSNVALLDGETLVFQIESEAERSLFTPSPFLSITREANATDIGIARRIGWDAISGDLTVQIEAAFGDGIAHDDWVISATAGVAEAQRSMLDEVRVKHGEVTTKSGEVSTKHGETLLAATVAVDAKDAAETAA
ncbi:hypothetical protein, partial [Maritalea porphyrae]|uniref:hypothetical protein n=1 Tax=Maritalea porphyrae TaxID=880732 RepID=UPI0022AF4DD6